MPAPSGRRLAPLAALIALALTSGHAAAETFTWSGGAGYWRDANWSSSTFPDDDLDVALIDLSHINDLYHHAAARTICGLIGSDLLVKYKAVIDYSRLKLTLTAPKHRGNTLRQ